MRFSQIFTPTLKNSPADAEVMSHKLMIRSGMIRQLASGIYSILPLGLRVLRKIETIIRQEMDSVGGQEVYLPSVQPAELWEESGRWDFYGKELLRIQDRHNRHFCYGPTHEEVITDLIRKDVKSYKQLPLIMYQIQTKFRDEVRPRFGMMRGREFMMKDAYSFHKDQDSVLETYEDMKKAYSRIFERSGLDFKRVDADSGSIGGNHSHEFMVMAESGEDAIGFCSHCDHAANVEKAGLRKTELNPEISSKAPSMEEIHTPGTKTIDEVSSLLSAGADQFVKTLLLENEKGLIAALVRGDRQLNLAKMKSLLGCDWLHAADEQRIAKAGLPLGFIGPVGIDIKIYVDHEVANMDSFISGSNKRDYHLRAVVTGRDFKPESIGDIRLAEEGDSCPKCDVGLYQIKRGIEVGHIFVLGTKYSESMKATFLDPNGKSLPFVMGCYGIGVGRTAAAAIEQNHDGNGIIWPKPIAPFQVIIIPVDPNHEKVWGKTLEIYEKLKGLGLEILIDDRKDRLGSKLKDADLIGIPLQIILGPKNLESGQIEIKSRSQEKGTAIPVDSLEEHLIKRAFI